MQARGHCAPAEARHREGRSPILVYQSKIENIITSYLKNEDLVRLSTYAKTLSNRFTKERTQIAENYFDKKETRFAYIAHFFIPNAIKVIKCLSDLVDRSSLADRKKIKILDLGSGVGTAALAAAVFFGEVSPDTEVEIIGVEKSEGALEDAMHLIRMTENKKCHFIPKKYDLVKQKLDSCLDNCEFDIVIAANFLNELTEKDSLLICDNILKSHLKDSGYFIIIDPALKSTTIPLMKLRDRLLSEQKANVIAPCLHQKECPMLAANERDWCHFYIEWKRPELIKKMDELVGTNHEYLKMAYLILAREAVIPAKAGIQSSKEGLGSIFRVVSSPIVSKGKIELFLCGSDGELRRVMRQNKDESELNADFGSAKRGDVVRLSLRNKIKKEDQFRRVVCWRLSF